MKLKFILLVAALGAVGAWASPAELCAPQNAPVVSSGTAQSQTVACASLAADPGDVITSYKITVNLTWQDSSGNNTSTTMSTTATPQSPSTLGSFVVTAVTAGGAFGNTLGGGSASGSVTGLSLAMLGGFNVNFSTPTFNGATIPANATVSVNVTTTEAPSTSTTPEPTSMLLFGSGLLFMGMAVRRKRA